MKPVWSDPYVTVLPSRWPTETRGSSAKWPDSSPAVPLLLHLTLHLNGVHLLVDRLHKMNIRHSFPGSAKLPS